MVVPVVVVGDVVGAVAAHAAEACLATVPETAVGCGDVFRVSLDIDGAIAFGLVGIATCLPVEEVHVMHPDVAVVGVHGYGIIHEQHDGKVADLHALAVAHEETEAAHCGIFADTFQGDVHLAVTVFAFYLQALFRTVDAVKVVAGHLADDTEGDGCGVITFLVSGKDILQTGEFLRSSLAIYYHVGADGLCRVLCHV